MKHKTAELEGALLDAAVAKAEGVTTESGWQRMGGRNLDAPWSPTFQWADGGPIIERERISLDDPDRTRTDQWRATVWGTLLTREQGGNDGASALGTTPLIAAMRAFCASRFGEEVEL